MKKSELKQLIREELNKTQNESFSGYGDPKIMAWSAAETFLHNMRRINKITPGKEKIATERFMPDLTRLKTILSTLRVDYPSLTPVYKYILDIHTNLDNDDENSSTLKTLGGGMVIREFIEKVIKPLKKLKAHLR